MRSVPILIVGGGAAGMMAAAAVSGCGKKALIIEKMNQLGKKILATGNGRCNYTNLRQKPEFYHVDETDGVWEILKRLDEKKVISFLKMPEYIREKGTDMFILCLCKLFLSGIVCREK